MIKSLLSPVNFLLVLIICFCANPVHAGTGKNKKKERTTVSPITAASSQLSVVDQQINAASVSLSASSFDITGVEAFPNNTLLVFNAAGERVFKQKGYENGWDGRDAAGNMLPSGTYFVLIDLGSRNGSLQGYVNYGK